MLYHSYCLDIILFIESNQMQSNPMQSVMTEVVIEESIENNEHKMDIDTNDIIDKFFNEQSSENENSDNNDIINDDVSDHEMLEPLPVCYMNKFNEYYNTNIQKPHLFDEYHHSIISNGCNCVKINSTTWVVPKYITDKINKEPYASHDQYHHILQRGNKWTCGCTEFYDSGGYVCKHTMLVYLIEQCDNPMQVSTKQGVPIPGYEHIVVINSDINVGRKLATFSVHSGSEGYTTVHLNKTTSKPICSRHGGIGYCDNRVLLKEAIKAKCDSTCLFDPDEEVEIEDAILQQLEREHRPDASNNFDTKQGISQKPIPVPIYFHSDQDNIDVDCDYYKYQFNVPNAPLKPHDTCQRCHLKFGETESGANYSLKLYNGKMFYLDCIRNVKHSILMCILYKYYILYLLYLCVYCINIIYYT